MPSRQRPSCEYRLLCFNRVDSANRPALCYISPTPSGALNVKRTFWVYLPVCVTPPPVYGARFLHSLAQPPRHEGGGAEDKDNGRRAGQSAGKQEEQVAQRAEEDENDEDEAVGKQRGRGSQRSNNGAPAPVPAPGGWMTAHNAGFSSQKDKRRGGGAGGGGGGGSGGRGASQGVRVRGGGGAGGDVGGGDEEEDEEDKARLEAPLEAAVTEKCR